LFKKNIFSFLFFKEIGRVIGASFFAAVVIVFIFIGSDLFLVKEIEVLNSDLIDESSLFILKNKNIFIVRLNALIAKINEIPEIKSVTVRKKLPCKLIVVVEEYSPCAILEDNNKLAVSGEGVIFPLRGYTDEFYPLLIYDKPDDKTDWLLGQSYLALERAMRTYLSIRDIVSVKIIEVKTETEVFFVLKDTNTEIRMDSEEYEKEARYLAYLMKELPSKNIEYMDFRFGEYIPVKPY